MRTLKLLFLFLGISILGFSKDTKQDIKCLTQTIYYEARGDSFTGKLAVANVVMNRYRLWNYKSVCSVVSDKGQFGWYGFKNNRILEEEKWIEAEDLALLVYYRRIEDNTHGATFFHERTVKPSWSKDLTLVARIGKHIFYSERTLDT